MKKINTIGYGGKIIGVGLVFLCVIPAVLYGVKLLFHLPVPVTLLLLSAGIGACIELCFAGVAAVELWQDRMIDRYYTGHPSDLKTPQQILDDHRWHRKN